MSAHADRVAKEPIRKRKLIGNNPNPGAGDLACILARRLIFAHPTLQAYSLNTKATMSQSVQIIPEPTAIFSKTR